MVLTTKLVMKPNLELNVEIRRKKTKNSREIRLILSSPNEMDIKDTGSTDHVYRCGAAK